MFGLIKVTRMAAVQQTKRLPLNLRKKTRMKMREASKERM